MANTVRIGVEVPGVASASSALDKIRDKFTHLQRQGAKGFAIGAGAAVTAKALGLVDMALGKVIDVAGQAAEAYRSDQRSIAQLNTTLAANVKGWDGNTDAIEKTIAARQALGFTDDEQRDSLGRLVVATNDVNRALEIQRAAMDLSRLKGISLGEATDALIRVEGGQFRALKALGIELPATATQTEALAAVQKAAAGQAETYAKTNEGKLLVSQTKVGEAMEKVGKVIDNVAQAVIPPLADAVVWLAGRFGVVTDAIGAVVGPILTKLQPAFSAIWSIVGQVIGVIDTVIGLLGPPILSVISVVAGAFGGLVSALKGPIDAVLGFIDGVIGGIGTVIKVVRELLGLAPSSDRYHAPIRTDARPGRSETLGGGLSEPITPRPRMLQHGGPAMAGEPVIVGEDGPELFVPDRSGVVIPRAASGAAGGNVTVIFNSTWPPTPEHIEEIAERIDRIFYYRRAGAPA